MRRVAIVWPCATSTMANMQSTYRPIAVAVVALLCTTVVSRAAFACERVGPVSPGEMVRQADAIVRAQALGDATPPGAGNAEPLVKFRVLEVIRGKDVAQELQLVGYATDRDDVTDRPVNGFCYPRVYRIGAEFLLVLKKRDANYTVEWYPLGPVNERVHSPDDPWLASVRKQEARN
jgi:hypothetical protein